MSPTDIPAGSRPAGATALDLSGATALVTGSGRNLGLAIATRLALAGARVVVHERTEEDATSGRRAAAERAPAADIHAVWFDLGSPAAIDAGFDRLRRAGLTPSVLVNNAAHLDVGSGGFLAQSREAFREVLEVNLFAVHHLSRLAAEAMVAAGGGAIVMISSLAGERAIHGRPGYDASKAALDGLTRAMALELAPHGVRVNEIAPGYVLTDRWEELAPDVLRQRRDNTPGGAPTAGTEIAELVALLASERVPSMIGSRLVIDGGLAAQQVPRSAAV